MIKKVTLKNFEAHEDSTIEFTDGLNLIIGPSNQGKSSIIRAIGMVVANRFDKDSVRTGCEFCSVTVETEKGWVKAERGESVNRWTTYKVGGEKKEYHSIGTGTPPDALEILGMGERERGGIKELPNITFQLEKHYMLSEIDGKKATSNMIARMMDDAIGIGGMEELISSMASDFQTYKKNLNTCSTEISLAKGEIMEESIFLSKQKEVKKLQSLLEKGKELQSLLEDSEDFSEKVSSSKSKISDLNEKVEILQSLETIWERFSSSMSKYSNLREASLLKRNLNDLNREVESISYLEKSFQSLEEKFEKLQLIQKAHSIFGRIQVLSSPKDLEKNLENKLTSLLQQKKKIEEANLSLLVARKTFLAIRRLSEGLKESQKELESKEKDLEKLKSELGVCPLCGREFSECKDQKE